MSNLNPGGSRYTAGYRIYGYENIKQAIKSRKPDHAKNAHNSIAVTNRHGGLHEHKREIARRLRQQGHCPS